MEDVHGHSAVSRERDWWPRADRSLIADPATQAAFDAVSFGALVRASYAAIVAHGLVVALIALPFAVVEAWWLHGTMTPAEASSWTNVMTERTSLEVALPYLVPGVVISIVLARRLGPVGTTRPTLRIACFRVTMIALVSMCLGHLQTMIRAVTLLDSAVMALSFVAIACVQARLFIAEPIALREDLGVRGTWHRTWSLTRGISWGWTFRVYAVLLYLILPVSACFFFLGMLAVPSAWAFGSVAVADVAVAVMFWPACFAMHECLLARERAMGALPHTADTSGRVYGALDGD